jgi:hypothetical protein
MKKIMTLVVASLLMLTSFAQSEKYTAAMKDNLALMDSVFKNSNVDGIADVSARFARIGDAEKTQWLPHYYAAFCQIMYAFMKNDPAQNDTYADKADQSLTKAEALAKNNSEISLLKAMSASLRMIVDPMSRYMEYGPKIQKASAEAMKEDPTNPRVYWFNGVSMKNTPEQFGGGCGVAKPMLEKAVQLFDSFKPASELHPTWGKEVAQKDLAGCN